MRKLIVVDTETAGLDPNEHSIISFAAVIYQDGGISGHFQSLIQENPIHLNFRPESLPPDMVIHPSTGIQLRDLVDAPSPWVVVQEFKNWLLKNEIYGQQILCSHNVTFDSGFLRRLWNLAGEDYEKQWSHRMLCTQTAALLLEQAGRIRLPGGSASLDSVAAVFGLERSSNLHNALEDATLAARVLAKMVDKLK